MDKTDKIRNPKAGKSEHETPPGEPALTDEGHSADRGAHLHTSDNLPAADPLPNPDSAGGLRAARSDLALALVAMLFVLLPLYRTPILEDSFLTPKLLLIQLAVVAVLGWRLVSPALGRRVSISPAQPQDGLAQISSAQTLSPTPPGQRWVTILLGLFVLVQVPSFLWAPSSAMVVTALVYFSSFVLLYLVCRLAVRGTAATALIFNCGLTAAVATGAWTIYEDWVRGMGRTGIVARLPDWRGYLSAGLGNSGHIAGFMGLFLPWGLLAYFTAQRWRWGLMLALLVMAGAFVVTWSVGSSGATLLSIGLWSVVVAVSPFRGMVRWKRAIPLLAGTVAVAAFYLLPHPLNPHQPSLWHEAFGSQRWAEGWPTRVVIWMTTWHMIAENPLLGIGAGNFTREYVQQVVPGILADPKLRIYAGAFTNDAHNEYLQVWCEGGLAALLCFIGVFVAWGVAARRMIREVKRTAVQPGSAERFWLIVAAGAGITVFLLDSLMTFPVRLPAHFAALMFFLAVPACCMGNASNTRIGAMRATPLAASISAAPPAHRIPFRVTSVLLFLALICTTIHFRRVVAEYYLKQARTVVENAPVIVGGHPMSAWQAADLAVTAGITQLANGNRAGAEALFDQAREFTRNEAFDLAHGAFRAAFEWDDNYTNNTSRLAQLEIMRRNYVPARSWLLATLKHLQVSDLFERLGVVELMLGNPEAAIEAWEEGKRRRPMQAEHYDGLIRQAQP